MPSCSSRKTYPKTRSKNLSPRTTYGFLPSLCIWVYRVYSSHFPVSSFKRISITRTGLTNSVTTSMAPNWALFISEFLIYWGHRFSHELPLLWRFHAVHHSSPNLDWLAGERRHPMDQIFMSFFVGIPMVLSGFSLVDLLIVGAIQNVWDMTIHANLGWRLKFLDGIWVTSEFHHWHHSIDKEARDKLLGSTTYL